MREDSNTLQMYCSLISLFYSKHAYDKAEGFLRSILFDAYRDGLTSQETRDVEKAIREEIEKLNSFNDKLCKKDTRSIEKYLCACCEYRPSSDAEAS